MNSEPGPFNETLSTPTLQIAVTENSLKYDLGMYGMSAVCLLVTISPQKELNANQGICSGMCSSAMGVNLPPTVCWFFFVPSHQPCEKDVSMGLMQPRGCPPSVPFLEPFPRNQRPRLSLSGELAVQRSPGPAPGPCPKAIVRADCTKFYTNPFCLVFFSDDDR